MQRLANRKMLKHILSERKGHFVPIQSHDLYLTDEVCQMMKVGDLEVHRIRSVEEPRMREAKDFMLSTFYQEAPIPRALKLGDPSSAFSFQNNDLTRAFLEKEMKMYMASGASVIYKSRGQCVAVNFSCIWERNLDYEVLDERFDASLWHNVAADLASEHENPLAKNVIWRDYQFQHLYNLAQRLMEKSGKPKTLYAGALYFSPALRDLGLSVALVRALSTHYRNSDSILLCQSNFRGFDKFILREGNVPQVAEFVRYDDEELVLDETEGRAFSILSKLDGIKFFTDQ